MVQNQSNTPCDDTPPHSDPPHAGKQIVPPGYTVLDEEELDKLIRQLTQALYAAGRARGYKIRVIKSKRLER